MILLRHNSEILHLFLFSFPPAGMLFRAPCDSHWDAVMHILQYIKNALGCGLLYEDKGNAKIVRLIVRQKVHYWLLCFYWRKFDLMEKQKTNHE